MIKEEDYLKAKQIIREYEKQLNISVTVIKSVCECGSTKFNTTVKDKPFCFLCGKDARQTVL
jgi:hypothetical protein